jgi:hypothetical protein
MTISDTNLHPYLAALESDDSEGRLLRLLINFKNRGGKQPEAEEILHQTALRSGAWGGRDSRDGVLETVLNCVTGQCSMGNHIFAEDFDEKHFYRTLPGSG